MRSIQAALTPIACALLSLIVAPMPGRSENAPIRWYKNLQQASAAAVAQNKPIMIEFWADWCEPCKVMETQVYADPQVAALVAGAVIPLRLAFDNEKQLVRQYNVEAIPYLIFATSYGTELLHNRGILGAKELTAIVKALPADISEFNRLDRLRQKDAGNFAALKDMAARLREAGLYSASNAFYDKAVKSDSAKKNPALKRTLLREMGQNFLDLRDGKDAAAVFDRCIKEFPAGEEEPACLLGMGQTYLLMGKKDEAKKALDSILQRFPESASAAKARQLLAAP